MTTRPAPFAAFAAFVLLMTAWVASAQAVRAPAQSPIARPKRLIEMGWDEPDPAFMRKHLAQFEASPFDGCVFHLLYRRPDGKEGRFAWEAWGERVFTEAELAPALADLRATPFRRFRSNFLRINVTPGRTDWFDDYAPILSNLTLGASVARRGGTAGILFDTEQYEGRMFEYGAQRDTSERSREAYAAQARKRGMEVMRAFEKGWPGLTVFLTLGVTHGYIWADYHRAASEQGPYALLAPFVDGMILAASDSARIVDGTEDAYPAREPREIERYREAATIDALDLVTDSTRYRRVVSRSYGIWLDHDWPRRGWNTRDPDANYRTPAQLRAVVRRALERADDYVWIYSETPRWWTDTGRPTKLPKAYDRALRAAKRGLGSP